MAQFRQRQMAFSGERATPSESSHADPSDGSAGAIGASQPVEASPDLRGRTIYVVDAFALLFQVFHAMPEMTSPHGQPIGCVFGFTRDLVYLMEERKPDYLFVAYDAPGPTFRHELFADYKADRVEMPEALRDQLPNVLRMNAALAIPAMSIEGFEADDIMATLARRTEALGGCCYLVTHDKDCRQLISEHVQLFNIRKQETFGAHELLETWGIRPDQVVDFQALVGDPVDNVPGIPLIGPKIASQLLQEFQTLEGIYQHLDQVAGAKRRENLAAGLDTAQRSRQLVALTTTLPLPIDWDAARPGNFDPSAVAELCREFGFRGFSEKFSRLAMGAGDPEAATRIRSVDTADDVAALRQELQGKPPVALSLTEFETSSETPHIRGCALCWSETGTAYVPLNAREPSADKAARVLLQELLQTADWPKSGYDVKRQAVLLRSEGWQLHGIQFDALLAAYLLDAGSRNYAIDELARRYLGHTLASEQPAPGLEMGVVAALAEAQAVRQLADVLTCELQQQGLQGVFTDLELPLIPVLVEMESQGIRIDPQRLNQLSQKYHATLETLEHQIYELAGERFNINAPKQLGHVLFDRLGLPVLKKTKTGPSTDAEVLEQLAPLHALPQKVVEYRQYAKLLGTYVDALPRLIRPDTGRVHTTFNQVVAATGRLSSSDPNLQNIPIRSEAGAEIRSAFVPGKPDWSLLSADYSQIELRVLAHYSRDTSLLESFRAGEDIHARVAGEVFGVPHDQVTSAMRRTAKAVNFGVVYGQSAFGLAKSLGIGQEDAAAFIEKYFDKYAGMASFMEELLDECRRDGCVRTMWGRKRTIPGVRERARRDWRQRNLQERTAINTVIQGSAADIIKRAMICVAEKLRQQASPARMLLQIHDELLFEVPQADLEETARMVQREMESVVEMAVPLKVDARAGPTWASCEPLPAVRDSAGSPEYT